MRTTVSGPLLVLACAAIVGCSEDVPVGEPGGMGGERPETPGEVTPPLEVMQETAPGPIADTATTVGADEGRTRDLDEGGL